MIFLHLLCSITISIGMAQSDSSPQFLKGVSDFESQNWNEAEQTFQSLLQEYPDNPALLFNLGRVQYEKGHIGLALGLWRKARSLAPNFERVTTAIEFAEERHFPESNSPPVYMIIFNFLRNISLHFWLGFSFIFFLIWGYGAVEYGVKRQIPLPQWPSWLHVCLPVFMVALVFASYLAVETFEQKATIIVKDLETHINPSETSPTLAQLYEGQVVVVDKFLGDWAQIRSLNGTPGWVPRESIIIFGSK